MVALLAISLRKAGAVFSHYLQAHIPKVSYTRLTVYGSPDIFSIREKVPVITEPDQH